MCVVLCVSLYISVYTFALSCASVCVIVFLYIGYLWNFGCGNWVEINNLGINKPH